MFRNPLFMLILGIVLGWYVLPQALAALTARKG